MTDPATRADRLARLRGAMANAGVDLVALAPTDNLRWLLGFAPLYDERTCVTLVSAGAAVMAVPALNADQVADRAPELDLRRFTDEDGPEAALRAALELVGVSADGPLAVDPEMRAGHLLAVLETAGGRPAVDGSGLLGALREVKDPGEIASLAASARIADLAVTAGLEACVPGARERDVAAAIERVFREHGCVPEFALVGAGENGAFPHHETGDRVLRAGDAVVVDVGAIREGHHSDITRMACVGAPTARLRKVHGVVEAAVVAAMAAVRPGATCGEIDTAARRVIADAGFGDRFVHRTGHGLGLSGHEAPYVMDGSDVAVAEGMVFSIEPGIYLTGELGVRLEDIVHVTADGCERFSALPRELHVVG